MEVLEKELMLEKQQRETAENKIKELEKKLAEASGKH